MGIKKYSYLPQIEQSDWTFGTNCGTLLQISEFATDINKNYQLSERMFIDAALIAISLHWVGGREGVSQVLKL